MKNPEHKTDWLSLLEAFVASKRSERAFTALVENLGTLIYSRALRRTGNPQLAEEITQNVFAVLARKAESLRRHPSLRAWILETTRLQAASAMRSEQRRQRKLAALTSEANARHPGEPAMIDTQARWKEAVPHLDAALDRLSSKERDLVVQRFYEGRKFREIAAASGRTEDACGKGVKRALEKLSRMLTARGVTLSTAVVASALGTELARSAPLQSATVLTSKALAASSSIPTTALLANTLQTMSNIKTTTLTATVVLAAAAIPLSHQAAEARRIQAELQSVSNQQTSLEPGSAKSKTTRPDLDRETGARKAQTNTARSMLTSLGEAADNRTLIRVLMGSGDALASQMAYSRVARMSPEELRGLRDDIEDFPMPGVIKDMVNFRIGNYAPEQTPRELLEGILAGGRSAVLQSHMKDWATSEPEAALAWYLEKRSVGDLDPGLSGELHDGILGDLLLGLASSNPAKSLEFYRELPKEEIRTHFPRWMASAYAKEMMASGDDTHFLAMLELSSGDDRKQVLQGTLNEYAKNGRFDAGMALVDEHNPAPQERYDYVEALFESALPFEQLADGLEWVSKSTAEEEQPAVIRRMVATARSRLEGPAEGWLERQPPGAVRDHGYAGIVDDMVGGGEFPAAVDAAGRIDDASLRATTRQLIGRKWLEENPEQAAESLPGDLLEQLQNQ